MGYDWKRVKGVKWYKSKTGTVWYRTLGELNAALKEVREISSAKIAARNKAVIAAEALRLKEAVRKAEKKRLGTSWLAKKDVAVKAKIKAIVEKHGYGGIPKPKVAVVPTSVVSPISVKTDDTFPLKAVVVVGMVGIGAAVLIYMRRKKR